MVKQVKSRRAKASRTTARIDSHQLFLAGLGALSLGRKQGVRLFGSLVQEGQEVRGRVRRLVAGASGRVERDVRAARGRLDAALLPLRGRMTASITSLSSQLQPLLARLGVSVRAGRAPARRARARKATSPRQVRAGRRIKAA